MIYRIGEDNFQSWFAYGLWHGTYITPPQSQPWKQAFSRQSLKYHSHQTQDGWASNIKARFALCLSCWVKKESLRSSDLPYSSPFSKPLTWFAVQRLGWIFWDWTMWNSIVKCEDHIRYISQIRKLTCLTFLQCKLILLYMPEHGSPFLITPQLHSVKKILRNLNETHSRYVHAKLPLWWHISVR